MLSLHVKWGEAKVKLTWQANNRLPDDGLVTSVHGFCFYKNQLLLVELEHRGWDFPGGHIEEDEAPEESLHREAMEEGYVSGSCQLIGSIKVDHAENPLWDEEGKYPMIGYQAFYKMDIEKIHDFKAEYESTQRIWVPLSGAGDYHHDWNELYQEILFEAICST